jgi:hypothetical protein
MKDSINSGQVCFKGKTLEFKTPRDVIHAGVALLSRVGEKKMNRNVHLEVDLKWV